MKKPLIFDHWKSEKSDRLLNYVRTKTKNIELSLTVMRSNTNIQKCLEKF